MSNLYTVQALAKKSGYCTSSINRWIRQGVLTKHQVNGKTAVNLEEFEKFLSENNVKKPYKKGKKTVEPVSLKTTPIELPKHNDKSELVSKLADVLDYSYDKNILKPRQFKAIEQVWEELNKGE